MMKMISLMMCMLLLFGFAGCNQNSGLRIPDATVPNSSPDIQCTHQDSITINTKAATCKEAGYTGDLYCKNCKTVISQGQSVQKTDDHKTVLRGMKEATEHNDGYTGDEVCTVCGVTVKAGKVIVGSQIKEEKTATKITKTADLIQADAVVTLESNSIKKNKCLYFEADIISLGTIVLRHGQGAYGAGHITIDDTNVECYRYVSSDVLMQSMPHGLTISGKTTIQASVGKTGKVQLTITSNGASFFQEIAWYGTRGAIEMESVATTMRNLTLTWECTDYLHDIWFFGDSYFEIDTTRWPYYLLKSNDDFLLSGFGGADASQMYADFQTALTHATPRIAVWCLGMNNGDSESGINQSWRSYTEKFVADCKAKGIIPILTTTPNTPTVINIYKNEYVRNSGCRYIDFASAVGAVEKGSGWHAGMLSGDNIHPAAPGGQALAQQILIDLPEIND